MDAVLSTSATFKRKYRQVISYLFLVSSLQICLFFSHLIRYRTCWTAKRHRRCVLSSKDGHVWWAIAEFSIPWTFEYMLYSLTNQEHVSNPWRLLCICVKAESTLISFHIFYLDIDPSIKHVALEHYIAGKIWIFLVQWHKQYQVKSLSTRFR